jgi:hypothetical protein
MLSHQSFQRASFHHLNGHAEGRPGPRGRGSTGMRPLVFRGFPLSTSEVESSDPLNGLLLVGCDHGDPMGLGRALGLLHRLQPDVVLLELSPYARSFRARRQGQLLKALTHRVSHAARALSMAPRLAHRHPEVVRIRRQICLPYEYRAARKYASSRGARIVLCDSSAFSGRCLASWPEMLSWENLLSILSGPGRRDGHEDGYSRARRALGEPLEEGGIWTRSVEDRWGPWWDRRERHLARTAWRALHILQPRSPLYLGGWQHLLPGRRRSTLRGLLCIPPGRCLLLPDDFSSKSIPAQMSAEQSR